MRNASSLGKEWYEHSEGYCSYLKGKTEKEVADIPADGSDADLAALCTISIDAFCKRPQGMRLRMRHYKLNGKSDRHREVAVFFLSFVQIHRKPDRKGAVCGQNAKKSVFLLQNGAKRAIL
ncbi:MAG: hypothetical protein V8R76_01575 [Faecalibacterium sp.]